MIPENEPQSEQVRRLKSEFDRSFQTAALPSESGLDDFLGLRVGGMPYAVRLKQISRIMAGKRIVPIHGSAVGLHGITGFRGTIVPVFDLRGVLGYPGGGLLRWIMLTGSPEIIALAFDSFDGYLRVARETIAESEAAEAHFIREVVRTENTCRPIIDVSTVAAAVTAQARSRKQPKEK
jgi:purine-binding chemotaxis protein CheW